MHRALVYRSCTALRMTTLPLRTCPSHYGAFVGSADSVLGCACCFSFANPKSSSFAPFFVSITFPGFKSR
jgi:hypothetical protein